MRRRPLPTRCTDLGLSDLGPNVELDVFIGNSFTYGHGSAVRFYRADTVTDLNSEGSLLSRRMVSVDHVDRGVSRCIAACASDVAVVAIATALVFSAA